MAAAFFEGWLRRAVVGAARSARCLLPVEERRGAQVVLAYRTALK